MRTTIGPSMKESPVDAVLPPPILDFTHARFMSDPPSAGSRLGATTPPRGKRGRLVKLAVVVVTLVAGGVAAALIFYPAAKDAREEPKSPTSLESKTTTDQPSEKSSVVEAKTSRPAPSRRSSPSIQSLDAIPGAQSQSYYRSVEPIMRLVDPQRDGWNTEVFHQAAGKQLKRLGRLLTQTGPLDPHETQQLVTDDFIAAPLRPQPLTEVFNDGSIVVKRHTASNESKAHTLNGPRGSAAFASRIGNLSAPLSEAADVRVKFKIFRVNGGDEPETTSYFQASGTRDGATVQLNATWTCRWREDDGAAPRLVSIRVSDYEEIVPRSAGGLRFADWTQSVLGQNESFHQQLTHGIDHWRDHLQRSFQLDFTGHHGIAVGDVNGDGLDDLYVCQPGGLPNRLYVRQQDGTLIDRSRESGTDWMELTRSALLVDLDNDGDQDLVLAHSRRVRLFSNDGLGKFTPRGGYDGDGFYMSLSAADYDGDSDLDLFVCAYSTGALVGRTVAELSQPTPYHDANNGARNRLLRNDGQWKLTDVTAESGMDQNNRRFSFAAAWEDFDNDGDMDLYVANDFGRNNLYRNHQGRFEDVAVRIGVEDISAGMGVTWGDYNNDGHMDLYVSNMFSSAGGRIAYQREFRDGSRSNLNAYRRHARGNTLFQNRGGKVMADVSLPAGVNMGRWAWGAKFVDLNNDGWLDLYVPNGYVTSDREDDL